MGSVPDVIAIFLNKYGVMIDFNGWLCLRNYFIALIAILRSLELNLEIGIAFHQ